jgi:predicted MFS family arabinose efflux permease
LNTPESFDAYAVGACLQTFAFGFVLPIAIAEVAELDHDGRYIILSVPAIGIGAMAGPGIAGVLSQSGSFGPLLTFGAVTIVSSATLIAYFGVRARRAQPG